MDQIDPKADNLRGMNAAEAKEYIFQYVTTLKLTEKKFEEVTGALTKWRGRVELARSRGEEALAQEAEREVHKFEAEGDALTGEIRELTGEITRLRRQIPGLAARERSVDPDLLEQELLMALGHTLGEGDEGRKTAGEFEKLNADRALDALKEKMRRNP